MSNVVEAIAHGDIRLAARMMRDLDDRIPAARLVLPDLYKRGGKAHIVGITGNPGAGKSTVVDALIAFLRARGERVGVVAIDPSSPYTGGAILGDRIRMQRHALDEGVFIRSLATRGHLGGLSRSTFDVVTVMDAMGYDRILIETVGVGQDEVDIMRAAHTTVVVTVPGLGDDVQAMKGGLLEVADVLCVNKADREGSDRTVRDLTMMLELRAPGLTASADAEIVKTVAVAPPAASGIDELMAAVDRHRAKMGTSVVVREKRVAAYVRELVRSALEERVDAMIDEAGGLPSLARRIESEHEDPFAVAAQLLSKA